MVVLQPRTAETKSSAEKSQSESCIKQSTAKHPVAGARKSVSDDVIDLTDNNNVEKIVAKVLQLDPRSEFRRFVSYEPLMIDDVAMLAFVTNRGQRRLLKALAQIEQGTETANRHSTENHKKPVRIESSETV